jgi:hypothetical protein
MANLSIGFARLAWVISILAAAPGLFLGVANTYENRPRFAANSFLLAALCFIFPWVIFFVVQWVARGFRSKEYLPILNRETGELTLAGFEPEAADWPLGVAHATLPLHIKRQGYATKSSCDRCGASEDVTPIMSTPRGVYCIRHAGWYARAQLIKGWGLLLLFWFFALVGIATMVYFAYLWWLTLR